MKKYKIAVTIPVYNAKTTIIGTLNSLFEQTLLPDELIIVNDGCTDESPVLIKNFLKSNDRRIQNIGLIVEFVSHDKPQGIAASYNDGIRKSSCELVIILQADIILKPNSLEVLTRPFLLPDSLDVVASYHLSYLPYEVWEKHNFWQKCFFSRFVGKKWHALDGKFDCFRKSALEQVGYFNSELFRYAGEDGDIQYKLKKIGRVLETDAEIIHMHSTDPKFSYVNIITKYQQYSEAQAMMLRLGELSGLKYIPMIFFREFLVLGLFIPYVNILSAAIIVFYSFFYTKLVYIKEYRDKRIFILPFINIYLIFSCTFYSIRTLIYGKQY